MATRARAGGIGIQQFLIEAERGLSALSKESPKELIASTMAVEGKRLDEFLWSAVFAADKILDTGVVPSLIPESSYFEPPLARPQTKLRPSDDYFKQVFNRRGSKELREHPGFRWDLVLPQHGHSSALELEAGVYIPYHRDGPPHFELTFEVNYDDTLTAFKWLLREWRRPIGQLLRGLPNVELWGNGTTIDGPKDCRSKDPAFLLEYHLALPRGPDISNMTPNLFSLRSSFSPEDTDEDVVVTCAVFLCLFDSVYRLTCDRVEPDRLLKHYHTLLPHIPKAPFRAASIFPKEGT
jgi:hypothetical protein